MHEAALYGFQVGEMLSAIGTVAGAVVVFLGLVLLIRGTLR